MDRGRRRRVEPGQRGHACEAQVHTRPNQGCPVVSDFTAARCHAYGSVGLTVSAHATPSNIGKKSGPYAGCVPSVLVGRGLVTREP